MDTHRTEDRSRPHQIACGKKSGSDTSLQILGLQSINPPHEECLEMGTCFLEEQLDRYCNAPKYAVP